MLLVGIERSSEGEGGTGPPRVMLDRKPLRWRDSVRDRCRDVLGMEVRPRRAREAFWRCEQVWESWTRDMVVEEGWGLAVGGPEGAGQGWWARGVVVWVRTSRPRDCGGFLLSWFRGGGGVGMLTVELDGSRDVVVERAPVGGDLQHWLRLRNYGLDDGNFRVASQPYHYGLTI